MNATRLPRCRCGPNFSKQIKEKIINSGLPETLKPVCFQELKEAFEPYNYILTAALGAGKSTMETAYDLTKLSRYLDFIHMMCYDYHGTWDGVVGANAPLKGVSDDDILSLVSSGCF